MQKNGAQNKIIVSFSLVFLVSIAAICVFFLLSIKKFANEDEFNNIVWWMILMIPVVLAFVLTISYLIASKVMAPLKTILEAVDLILRGESSREIDVRSNDEFQDLAMHLKEMSADWYFDKIKRNELERTVDGQISNLENKVMELKGAKNEILNVANEIDEERKKTIIEKDKINAILHSIGDGVFVVNKDQKVIIINEVAANMVGYRTEEVLGMPYAEKLNFIFEKTGKVNSEFIEKAFETKTVQKMSNHTVLVCRDGSKINVSNSAAPLLDSDSNVIGCVVVFRNVTKEREIDKAKTEFVSLASHQLRTPLSVINWYSEMLLDGDAGEINEEQKKYVEEIYKGNQRMVDLVNSLLNVSRLELGTFVVEPEMIDIVALAKSAADELKPQVAEKKQKFQEYYADDIPAYSADPKLLRMVFQNILSNAVKYTPSGGNVSINMNLVNPGDGFGGKIIDMKCIAVKIADTGYGITASQQDKIFTKLFRADNVRQKNTEGTGLGMYIVKSIVDISGGMIWFDSVENKGTTFYVLLPLRGMKKKEGVKKLS